MPPDPLENPIAFLTDHPVLAAEAEAALIATMRAGVDAREAIRRDLPPADPAVLHQVALGEEARATLVRHNLRLVVPSPNATCAWRASTSPWRTW